MIGKIELPVGTRFKIHQGGTSISYEAVESTDCERCAFYSGMFGICPHIECAKADREDETPVIFEKLKTTKYN